MKDKAKNNDIKILQEKLEKTVQYLSKTKNDLRESEQKLDSMLRSITDYMIMMDKEFNITWANETARSVFGDDIVGKKCYRVYHRRRKPCEPQPCILIKAFDDEQTHAHDTEVTGKDGQKIYFHSTAHVAFRDQNGNPTTVLEISRDITASKFAEMLLRAQHDELWRKSKEDEAELKIAYKVQQSILPHKVPSLKGVNISARSIPAKKVGGDFYYFRAYRPEDEKTCVIIGDVAGKGVAAALLMALSLSTFEQLLRKHDADMEDILHRVNRAFLRHVEKYSGYYVTAFCGVLDIKKHAFTYHKAGHVPPILLRKTRNSCRLLKGKGTALGLMEKGNFEKKRIILKPGDKIIIYTDGITDVQNDEMEIFGENRLRKLVKANGEKDAQGLLDAIFSEIEEYRGSQPQKDDMTLVILEVLT